MTTVTIDETKPLGKSLLKELAKHPRVAHIEDADVKFDASGKPVNCTPWEEVERDLLADMSKHYGVDFK